MPSKITTNMTGMEFDRIKDVPVGTPYDEIFMMLEARIDNLEAALMQEEALRKDNPALQDLYNQYLTTKKLLGKG